MDSWRLQQRRRSLTPSSMSRTLWSSTETPTKDHHLRLTTADHHNAAVVAAVNVNVLLRCRPINEDEKHEVIWCDEAKQQVTVTNNKQGDRTFLFDKVFGPLSQQQQVYEDVVAPVVNEVVEGYSCTIFAYGQTGTGKTYTMEGEATKEKNGKFHKNAGIIPRAVQEIFDILERGNADYSMKVTYVELYNEEITDLLAPDFEGSNSPLTDKQKRPLVLMEDGKGAVFVRGLEEESVHNADQVHAILQKGSGKKHTADTLLNKQSNRSHSIFSIMVQVKEQNSDGSELIKCGKLNLVDLAGSENILRSGAREVRAREAGEINKSLLTLGRVINALADNSGHVPYRDSKLTRLLRDSLGGKTKTCMIATISPSILSLEETISTLDYAFRAKSIKNTPEVNQKLYFPKRLKQDVESSASKQLMELQELYLYQQQLTVDLKDKLENTQRELADTKQSLSNLEDKLQHAEEANKEKDNSIFNLLCSGKELTERALELRSDLEHSASDVSTLFSRIRHKNDLEDRNRHHIQNAYSQLARQLEQLDKLVSTSVMQQQQNFKLIQEDIQTLLSSKAEAIDEVLGQIEKFKDSYSSGTKTLDESAGELYQNSQMALRNLSLELSNHSSAIVNLVKRSSSDADTVNNSLKNNLHLLGAIIAASIQQQEEMHSRSFQSSKSIVQNLQNFSKTLNVYISKLRLMEEDSQFITKQKLSAFRNKFEEFALGEEKLLLGKIAELLTSSTLRKNNLIQAAVDDIVKSATERSKTLNEELYNMQSCTADAQKTLNNYTERTDSTYLEDTATIESNKATLQNSLHCCLTESTEVAEQWRTTDESLLRLLNDNVESVESLMKVQTESNENIYVRFSSVASSILNDTDDATNSMMFLAEKPLRLDHEAFKKISILTASCDENVKEMNSIHSEKVADVSETARKSLVDDYMVDDSPCPSPVMKPKTNLPSKEYLINAISGASREQVTN